MAEDKGFKPTPKKLRDAQKKGQTAKSQLLTQSVVVAGMVGVLFSFITMKMQVFVALSSASFEGATAATHSNLISLAILLLIVPLLVVVLLGILCEGMQVKGMWQMSLLSPRFERLNPVVGIQRMWESFIQSWSVFLKVITLLLICCVVIDDFSKWIAQYTTAYAPVVLSVGFDSIRKITYTGAVLFLVFGVVDLFMKRRKFYKEQSMSIEEIKKEQREEEGDPHLKSERKSLQYQMAMQEMQKRVRSSKVLLVEKYNCSTK